MSTAKDVISNLLIENTSNDNLNRYYRDDKLEFIRRFFESIVFTFDTILSEIKYADSVDNLSLVKRFWELWQHIFDIIKVNDKHGISNILLLGIDWKDTSENWMPLRHGEKIYEEIVKMFGERNLLPLIKFSSTAGSSILLPRALIWIVQIIKKEKIAEAALLDKHAEILIKRLYFKHIGNLKRSPESINAFIYLLDTMVNLGSSSAYLYRENVITYKAVIS